jgi:hypothetical protein
MRRNFLKTMLLGAVFATGVSFHAYAGDLAPLNSDAEADRMDWSQLEAKFGALPKPAEGMNVGAVAKALTNEYWRRMLIFRLAKPKTISLVSLQLLKTCFQKAIRFCWFHRKLTQTCSPLLKPLKKLASL